MVCFFITINGLCKMRFNAFLHFVCALHEQQHTTLKLCKNFEDAIFFC